MKMNTRTAFALVLIFVLWITPGLFGRDPWKADEPYSFGLISDMIQTGDLVVPTLAGEPFLEKPPLFFLTAAGFGRLLSPPLELLNATRLAVAFYMFLALLFIGLAAKELYGKEYGVTAALLLLGCIHLQETAHKLVTDVALFAGFSIALYGFSLCARRGKAGGFWLGTGIGIGYLSKGLLAPGILGIVALALPVFFQAWRRKDYAVSLATAQVAALPWLIIWPAALYLRSPEFFVEWFWRQNLGRFLGFANAGGGDAHSYYFLNLPLLAWPAVLPAFWALWHFRRTWREHPVFQVPLVVFIVVLAVLSASSTNRAVYALPMLLPIALIAAPGFGALPVTAKFIANRASVLLLGVVALLLWFGWFAMMTGSPASIAQKLHEFQPDYVPAVNGFLLAIAIFYSVAWLIIVIKFTRSPDHAALNWALGVVLTWGLVMTLWLPALNAGSSYRAPFTSLKKALPAGYSCLASSELGESERAMVEYFAGIRTRRIETFGPGNCDLLLDERGSGGGAPDAMPGWKKIWEYKHPSSHTKNVFTLYKKVP